MINGKRCEMDITCQSGVEAPLSPQTTHERSSYNQGYNYHTSTIPHLFPLSVPGTMMARKGAYMVGIGEVDVGCTLDCNVR